MEMEQLLMIGAVCVAVYLAGYASLAVGIFIIMLLSMLVSKEKAMPKGVSAGGIKVSGAETLEPIVIETTRGPPFRIPSYMHMRINPNWGAATLYEKAMGKGLGRMARWAYRLTSGREWGD